MTASTRTYAPTTGAGLPGRVPKGADPGAWALAEALLAARQRLPYAAAEARLLDGLQRWVALGAKAPGPERLRSSGPVWAGVLAAVAAVARLCSPEAQTLLAPWTTLGAGLGAGAPGVSPAAARAAAFAASGPVFGGDEA